MIRTEREFCQMCISRGFSRLAPRFYARCTGDGVYQTIYTGLKKYMDTDSPYYSKENRKSYCVSIGIRSVYSHYEEHVFIPGKDMGGYSPADLYRKCKYSGPFNGIEEDYGYMEQVGFDVLDSIDTQEKLLEWWDTVQVIDTGHRIHDIHLVEPLLLCGKRHVAEYEISVSFIQGMDAYISYLNRVESGIFSKDNAYEQRIWNSAGKQMDLWRWCVGRNKEELCKYIKQNYNRNMAWIQEYGIPIVLLTQPRTLETI